MHHKERDALIVRTRAEVLRLRGGGEAIPKDVATQSGKEELTEWRAGGSATTAAAPTE